MPYWDERVVQMSTKYPAIHVDKYHIDILAAHFVQHPDRFDVVVASNLFGDILSDLGPATTGTIAIAPGGNINPEKEFPSMFEPVHGSAPDIAGKGIANPTALLFSALLMLRHIGEGAMADRIMNAVVATLTDGVRTPDLGGTATTMEYADAICQRCDR